jgi:hypothetical protein
MYQLLHDFVFGTPDVHYAIAWFVPLIASAVSAGAGLLAPKAKGIDQSAFKLGAGLENGSVDAPYFNFTNALARAQNSPGAANPYLENQNQFRDQQANLAALYGQTAMGQGPSLAETIVNQQFQKQQAALIGSIASQAGRPNVGMSQRLAAQGSQALGANAIEAAKTGRLAEIDTARTQLGNVLNQGRSGDLGAGSLAVQSDQARQQAINQILALAMQREQAAAELAAKGALAQTNQDNNNTDLTRKLIGSVAKGGSDALSAYFTSPAPAQPAGNIGPISNGSAYATLLGK